jgi:hypothetical protein
MFVIVSRYLIPKGFGGLTVFPFIIVGTKAHRSQADFINHEKIHIRQQSELLVLPFFIWYFLEYFIRLIQYKNGNMAYKNISFEREAYANEDNLGYLKSRRFWDFLKWL